MQFYKGNHLVLRAIYKLGFVVIEESPLDDPEIAQYFPYHSSLMLAENYFDESLKPPQSEIIHLEVS